MPTIEALNIVSDMGILIEESEEEPMESVTADN